MTEACKCKQALTMAFEEVALTLGGVVASYPIPDEAVWDLARALDVIHERASGRCEARAVAAADDADDAEHPAIVHLLAQLRSKSVASWGAGESDRGSK
jgi:hypothetical protein